MKPEKVNGDLLVRYEFPFGIPVPQWFYDDRFPFTTKPMTYPFLYGWYWARRTNLVRLVVIGVA